MDKKQDSRLTIRTALLNTIANIFALVVGVVMIPLLTRVITPEDLGTASTFVSSRNILVILILLAVYSFVHKAMLEFAEEKKDYIFSVTVFCIGMVAAVFVVSMPFRNILQHYLSLDGFLYYWLFVSVLVFALYHVGDYYCIFHNRSGLVFLIVLGTGTISQFLSIGLAYIMPENKYIGRILGLDMTYVVVAVVLVIWLLVTGRHRFRRKYITWTPQFTVPVIPHLLSQMVLTQCDLIMITYYIGKTESGLYSMGHTVGFLAFTVMSQLMAAWSPWVYRRLEEGDRQSIRHNAQYMILLGAYMSIGLMTITPELIGIFLTKEYEPCIYLVPVLVLAMFFQFIYLFFYDLEYYYKKAKWIASASVVAAVMNLVLNYICIPRFGFLAACYTTVASYLVLLVMSAGFAGKLGASKIYNLKQIILVSISVMMYMGIIFLLVDIWWARYALLAVITLVLLAVKYKDILEMVRGMKE